MPIQNQVKGKVATSGSQPSSYTLHHYITSELEQKGEPNTAQVMCLIV